MAKYDYRFSSIHNAFKITFPFGKFHFTEKIDGANLLAFSNGDMCSRNIKLTESDGRIKFNGYDVKPIQTQLKQILEDIMIFMKSKINKEFKIALVGEFITNAQTDLQKRYKLNERFKLGDFYVFGMTIYDLENETAENLSNLFEFLVIKKDLNKNDEQENDEQENDEKENDETDEQKEAVPKREYFRVVMNEKFIEFLDEYKLKHPEYFGYMSLEEFINTKKLIDPISDATIEGYMMTNEYGYIKFKNIFQNENSLSDIKRLLNIFTPSNTKEYKTQLKEKIMKCGGLDKITEILNKVKEIYTTSDCFIEKCELDSLVWQIINKGLEPSLDNNAKQKKYICDEVKKELELINKFSPDMTINSIVKIAVDRNNRNIANGKHIYLQ